LTNARVGRDGVRLAESLATVIAVDFLRAALAGVALRLRTRHPGARRVHQQMLQNYAYPWSIAELSRVAGLSVSQFLAVFGREFDCTPQDRLRQIRIDAAKGLLARGEDVLQAGTAVGFRSPSGFRAAFRRLVGVSPLEYGRSGRPSPDF